jgi:hypothetical protein
MNHSPLLTIRESNKYLDGAISIDALYSIARQKLVPVVRVGAGKILYPPSSLDLLVSGQIDLTGVTSRRQTKRRR